VVDEHESEQGVRFGFVGHELDEGTAEADRPADRSTRPPPQPSLKIR
jgi:hypothetical protein